MLFSPIRIKIRNVRSSIHFDSSINHTAWLAIPRFLVALIIRIYCLRSVKAHHYRLIPARQAIWDKSDTSHELSAFLRLSQPRFIWQASHGRASMEFELTRHNWAPYRFSNEPASFARLTAHCSSIGIGLDWQRPVIGHLGTGERGGGGDRYGGESVD